MSELTMFPSELDQNKGFFFGLLQATADLLTVKTRTAQRCVMSQMHSVHLTKAFLSTQ